MKNNRNILKYIGSNPQEGATLQEICEASGLDANEVMFSIMTHRAVGETIVSHWCEGELYFWNASDPDQWHYTEEDFLVTLKQMAAILKLAIEGIEKHCKEYAEVGGLHNGII